MEAETNFARTAGKGCKPRGAYYTPAARIEMVPGLSLATPKRRNWNSAFADTYCGKPEALAASGIIARELLPGEPGAPACAASYRPAGVKKGPDGWHRTPGYIQITRLSGGLVRAVLTVSEAEQARRRAEYESQQQAQRQDRQDALYGAPDFAESEGARQARLAKQLLSTLVQAQGLAAMERNLAEIRGARQRRPVPAYLRLAWSAPGA